MEPLRVDPNPNFDGNVLRGDRIMCSTSAEFAATIVRCVNAHDAMVAALKEAQWLVKQLSPGLRHLAIQDYERLNTAMLAIPAALKLARSEQ